MTESLDIVTHVQVLTGRIQRLAESVEPEAVCHRQAYRALYTAHADYITNEPKKVLGMVVPYFTYPPPRFVYVSWLAIDRKHRATGGKAVLNAGEAYRIEFHHCDVREFARIPPADAVGMIQRWCGDMEGIGIWHIFHLLYRLEDALHQEGFHLHDADADHPQQHVRTFDFRSGGEQVLITVNRRLALQTASHAFPAAND